MFDYMKWSKGHILYLCPWQSFGSAVQVVHFWSVLSAVAPGTKRSASKMSFSFTFGTQALGHTDTHTLSLSLHLHIMSHLNLPCLAWRKVTSQESDFLHRALWFQENRWKLIAHLWSRTGIVSLPAYSVVESSHRKAQIQAREGRLTTSQWQDCPQICGHL